MLFFVLFCFVLLQYIIKYPQFYKYSVQSKKIITIVTTSCSKMNYNQIWTPLIIQNFLHHNEKLLSYIIYILLQLY